MANNSEFEAALNKKEKNTIAKLTSPYKIQSYLNDIQYSSDKTYRCPLKVFQDGKGHCFDGALFAAAMLRKLGYPPLILDMIPNERDDDHILALFKEDNHWGAIAKSNFAGLRFREPIYRNLRELVLSYFEQYYNIEREKTLRGYTIPLNLKSFDRLNWITDSKTMYLIADRLDKLKRFDLLTPAMIKNLSLVDERLYKAGLHGANEMGLFKP